MLGCQIFGRGSPLALEKHIPCRSVFVGVDLWKYKGLPYSLMGGSLQPSELKPVESGGCGWKPWVSVASGILSSSLCVSSFLICKMLRRTTPGIIVEVRRDDKKRMWQVP